MQKSKKKEKRTKRKKLALSWIRTRDNITTLPGRRECPDMGRPDKGSFSVPFYISCMCVLCVCTRTYV